MLNSENKLEINHTHNVVKYPHKHTKHIQGGLP
jgi:hypothetical protein